MMIRNFGRKSSVGSALVVCLLVVLSARGQSRTAPTTAPASPSEISPVYDLEKEIKIQGKIQKIEMVLGPGVLGTHLQLQTAQGVVDVHLGSGAVASSKTLGLVTGQSVSLTGMMAEVDGAPVFFARVLTTSNRIFILRNERGLPARAIVPRGSSSAANEQKGGQ
jgi:hypothetical protein